MKKAAWLSALAITALASSLYATATLKPRETLTGSAIADSVKKAAPKLTAKDTSKPATKPAAAAPAPTPATAATPVAPPAALPAAGALPAVPKTLDTVKAKVAPVIKAATVVPAATAAPVKTPVDTLKAKPVAVAVPPKDSAVAKRYKIADRQLSRDEANYFLAAFQIRGESKPETSPVNTVWRDRASIMTYEPGTSEMAFTSESVAMLGQKDIVPDSLIRSKIDGILKSVLKAKAERYVFANYEITMVQKKDATAKDAAGKEAVQAPVPAFYIGRYIRKVDDRVVLGDAFQIRIGYGAEGALQSFSFRDPILTDGGSIKVPTREMVLDSLKRWERSKTHTRAYTYPYHSDHLHIKSLKPVKVFESYVMSQEKSREEPQTNGSYLLPSVTVLAQVIVTPSRQKNAESVPTEPVLLHFHFPCRPASGLCWPDGPKDLEDMTVSQARTPAASAPAATAPASAAPAPVKPEIPARK